MATPEDIVDAISGKMGRVVANNAPTVMYGTFVSAETNPRLSAVEIDQRMYRNVPKLASVAGLVNGSLCIILTGGSVPLTIIGRMS